MKREQLSQHGNLNAKRGSKNKQSQPYSGKDKDYNPTDNAIAERVNGILKTEVIYRERRFVNHADALKHIDEFIAFYNGKRPHSSIAYKVPYEAYQETGEQKCMWRSRGLSAPCR